MSACNKGVYLTSLPLGKLHRRWTSLGESVGFGLDFEIADSSPVAKEVRRRGFDCFLALAEHVRQLPYGRPAYVEDILAPLKEERGTCSVKHRLLAAVAHECGHSEINLVVGLYEMSEQNTPGVKDILERAGLESIPEAHCYLKLDDQRYDFTGLSSGSSSPFEALHQEHIIYPTNLSNEKVMLHQEAIRAWAKRHALSFGDAWALREACIHALESNNTLKQRVNKTSIVRKKPPETKAIARLRLCDENEREVSKNAFYV